MSEKTFIQRHPPRDGKEWNEVPTHWRPLG